MNESPLLKATRLAHEGETVDAVEAVAEEHERMAEKYLELIAVQKNPLSIDPDAETELTGEELAYYKGRLDEARTAAMTARQVWLGLGGLEARDE